MQAWEHICQASRKEFQAIYDRLGVTNIWRGESFYNPLLAPLVEEMEKAGISEDSDGAKARPCHVPCCYFNPGSVQFEDKHRRPAAFGLPRIDWRAG